MSLSDTELSPIAQALQYASLTLSAATVIFQSMQFAFMINGSVTQILFEIIYMSMVMFYPAAAIWVMFSPELEAALLLNSPWLVYISAVIQAGILLLNYDVILG